MVRVKNRSPEPLVRTLLAPISRPVHIDRARAWPTAAAANLQSSICNLESGMGWLAASDIAVCDCQAL